MVILEFGSYWRASLIESFTVFITWTQILYLVSRNFLSLYSQLKKDKLRLRTEKSLPLLW